MGYTTDFEGSFTIEPKLKEEHRQYLKDFSETRRMERDPDKITITDTVREAVGLPLGEDGGYFVGSTRNCGQDHTNDIVNYNSPPSYQPGLWCKWTPSEDGSKLEWSGMEKFYHYEEWLEYLIEHFFAVWGYTLNGEVKWYGEERPDQGILILKDNKLTVKRLKPVYE